MIHINHEPEVFNIWIEKLLPKMLNFKKSFNPHEKIWQWLKSLNSFRYKNTILSAIAKDKCVTTIQIKG